MSEEQHEQQSRDIRNIELKLERIEVQSIARNEEMKSLSIARNEEMKSLMKSMDNIDRKIDNFVQCLPKEYMTIREFEAYKSSVDKLLAERKDGNKSWQSWVMTLMPYIMSAILGLYVVFGRG